MTKTIDLRRFIQITTVATTGLLLACTDDGTVRSMGPGDAEPMDPDVGVQQSRTLRNWIRITEDEQVFIAMHKAEMGQGIHTTIPLIIAEELDVSLDQIRVEIVAEIDDYNLGTGLPLTYGSTSIRNAFTKLRKLGASAKSVLVQAAAARWAVDASTISTNEGTCTASDGRTLSYGELVKEASLLEPPEEPVLKDIDEFRLIGRDHKRFVDADIVEGRAGYGIDAEPEGCLYAAIRHAPTQNGVPQNVNALTSDLQGVEKIVGLPNAVAVIADSFWTAKRAVEALPVEFSEPEADVAVSSDSLRTGLMTGLDEEGNRVVDDGDLDAARAAATKTLTSEYFVPHIAHFPLEPVNATVHVTDEVTTVWLPTQAPIYVRNNVADALGVEPQSVVVHPTLLGGSFGRKADTDYPVSAALIAREVEVPVKLIWSREEDTKRDQFRPCFSGRFTGYLDAESRLVGLESKNCGDSVLGFGAGDPVSVEGLNPLPYTITNQRVEHVFQPSPIPNGFWRSIGHSQNTFFVESFLDEMAHLGERDPYELRRELLAENPRVLAVLDRAAELGAWGTPFTEGASQGIALCVDYGSILAVVCEATVEPDSRQLTIHRLSAAVDCGLVVRPTGVKAQVEGGLLFGLSAALYEEITLDQGRVQESNLYDYEILQPSEVPEIAVEIIDSTEAPGGMGEIAVGPAGPALSNAIFAASGIRCRTLPLIKELTAGT